MTPTVLYDGACCFCEKQAARLKWLTRGRVAFESTTADGVRETFPMLPPADRLDEVKFVDTDGRLYGGAAAIARAFVVSGGLLGLSARAYALPPVRWAADRAYRIAAAGRLKI